MSVMPGVARGEAGGRKTRCLCVQRGFFLLPRTSRRLSTPRRSHCATETCPCAGWVSIPSWEQRVRSGRVGAVAQVRCVSLEVLYERCAVHGAARCGDAAAPEGGAAKGSCEGAQGNADGDRRVRFFLRLASALWATSCRLQCSASVPCSGRCGFAVAGRWSGALVAERRVQSRHTQRDARMGRASGRRACLSGGWVCGAGCGPCAAVRLCVWAWRGGCREAKKRVPHACLCGRGSRLAPAASAGQPLCVRHTARRRLWGVQLVGQGRVRGWERREPARDAVLEAVSAGCPSPSVCVRPPG